VLLIILFHFNELPRFITLYLSVLVEIRWNKDAGTVLNFVFIFVIFVVSCCKFFFLYIYVLLRTALGHRAEIFILISFPLSCKKTLSANCSFCFWYKDGGGACAAVLASKSLVLQQLVGSNSSIYTHCAKCPSSAKYWDHLS